MDSTAPTIQCPTINAQSVNCGVSSATLTFNQATASDNCGTPQITYTAVSPTGTPIVLTAAGNFESGTFPVGTSVVTATATDGAGLTATCNVNAVVNTGIQLRCLSFAQVRFLFFQFVPYPGLSSCLCSPRYLCALKASYIL